MIKEGRGFGEDRSKPEEELQENYKKNFEKYRQETKHYDSRELADKFTNTNYIYGNIVRMFMNKTEKFEEYTQDRNRAQDAGLENVEVKVADKFVLPEGWVKEETENNIRYFNKNL